MEARFWCVDGVGEHAIECMPVPLRAIFDAHDQEVGQPAAALIDLPEPMLRSQVAVGGRLAPVVAACRCLCQQAGSTSVAAARAAYHRQEETYEDDDGFCPGERLFFTLVRLDLGNALRILARPGAAGWVIVTNCV